MSQVPQQAVSQKPPKPARDDDHLKRVRAMGCVICGRTPCEAHHCRVGPRTMGKRVSDYQVLPLCASHHGELHRGGKEEGFWEYYVVELVRFAGRAIVEGTRR